MCFQLVDMLAHHYRRNIQLACRCTEIPSLNDCDEDLHAP
jgi:hypothetical protein